MVVIHEQVVDYTDLLKCNCRELRELRRQSKFHGFVHIFSSCTTLIVSIFQLLLPSVWRKKIRTFMEDSEF